jgi:hypothetical protein
MPRQSHELDSYESRFRDWYKLRAANIRSHVSAADVLSRNGVTLRRHGSAAEQISCPFHGTDSHPSAKYFPEEGDSQSHVWCFVCHENWDAIGLWKKFTGTERFTDILRQIERDFGLTVPDPPLTRGEDERRVEDPLAVEVERLLDSCERLLREHRDSFELTRHLKLGSILDLTRHHLERGRIDMQTGKQRLSQIANRILSEASRAKASAAT